MLDFTNKQTDDLRYLRKISKDILSLYNLLCRDEFLYGKESVEYQKRREYIETCVEMEDDILKKFKGDPLIYQEAISYINDSSLGFERIVLRDSNSVLGTYDSTIRCENYEYVRGNTEEVVFSNLRDKSMVEFIDNELEHEKDIDKRELLIFSKAHILAHNRSLEQWYLSGKKDRDFMLLENDEEMAKMLGISLEQYKTDIKGFVVADMAKNVYGYLQVVLSGKEYIDCEALEMNIGALSRMLSTSEKEEIKAGIVEFCGEERCSLPGVLNVLSMLSSEENDFKKKK
ncbi:MAG: hypothetical protein J6A52_03700 [Bacilli bacterium]|nr:hypothetical protein [Bacilli bacterium]